MWANKVEQGQASTVSSLKAILRGISARLKPNVHTCARLIGSHRRLLFLVGHLDPAPLERLLQQAVHGRTHPFQEEAHSRLLRFEKTHTHKHTQKKGKRDKQPRFVPVSSRISGA